MNFYREGKVISLTSGTDKTIEDKHKAILLGQNSSITLYTLKFYSPEGTTSAGITYAVPAVSSGLANPFIIPASVKVIGADQNCQIVLLS